MLGAWPDTDNAHPRGIGRGTEQTRGQQAGVDAVEGTVGAQGAVNGRNDVGGQEQVLGLAALIALGLNHHMAAPQLDAIYNHLLVATVAQTQRQEEEAQP